MIAWWWLLAALAAGWVLRSVRTQAQLLRLGWDHAQETEAWAREATDAWARIDQLEDQVDRLEHEKATVEQLNDQMFDDETRRLLG